MKKVIAGASILLTGALMFMSAFIAAGSLGPIGGWDEYGPFWAAMSDNKLVPILIIAIIVILIGIGILFWGVYGKDDKK